MDWHTRYLQQARWTPDLRQHILSQAGIQHAERLLEVGCGTGVILRDLGKLAENGTGPPVRIHGLDIQAGALERARIHARASILTRGDAHRLPFSNRCFDVTCCHFLLLWLADPLGTIREMRRVTRLAGHVLALAEPDYSLRVDLPAALASIGELQARALRDQGADPYIGSRIASLFEQAGLKIVEAGTIAPRDSGAYDESESQGEWATLRADLSGRVADDELDRLESLDLQARRSGERMLHVPTFFVHAQV